MAIEQTTVVVYAREAQDRQDQWLHGTNAHDDTYGKIKICRSTKVIRKAEGDVGRKLGETEEVEDLLDLDVEEARHLVHTLTAAIIASLRVQAPRHL